MDKPSAGVRSACAICAMLPLFIPNPAAAVDLPSTRELAELSLEQLSNLEVTSVSKKPERLADAPASVFVITADDIRRSGVTSLPEALRLAPNLQVAQVSASAYNIRARGINNTTANKLLVLIDGRSVYSPLFSGVFWDVQNVMLEDIERIEVISGPGGTLWGVNAVNGVINVITKSSRATRGGLLAAGGGNRSAEAALRYGGDLGADGSFRVYGRYFDRNHSSTANGVAMPDGWYKAEGGFRADWSAAADQVMVKGNAYRGLVGQPPPGSISVGGVSLALAPIPVSGANLTGRWAHTLPGGSDLLVQLYYDRTERTVPPTFAEKLCTARRFGVARIASRTAPSSRSCRRTSIRNGTVFSHRARRAFGKTCAWSSARASSATITREPSSCPTRGSAGRSPPTICCGRRSPERYERPHGSTATHSLRGRRPSSSTAVRTCAPKSPRSTSSAIGASHPPGSRAPRPSSTPITIASTRRRSRRVAHSSCSLIRWRARRPARSSGAPGRYPERGESRRATRPKGKR